MKDVLVIESKTRLLVPEQCLRDPYHAPVFFNPRMKISRDFSVLFLSLLDFSTGLDAMAGIGARGIRYANEVGGKWVCNDISEIAVKYCRKNAELNNLKVEITQKDANKLFLERRFDIVDLDPFGTPAPFTQNAIRSARKYFFVTATDLSALSGSASRSCLRKYGIILEKLPFYREMIVRTLITHIILEAAKLDKRVEPIYSYVHEHHTRVFFRISRKSPRLDEIRFFEWKGRVYGPVYVGKLYDKALLKLALKRLPNFDFGQEVRKIRWYLERAAEEVETFGYWDLHELAREMGLSSPPSVEETLEKIKKKGLEGSRTQFCPWGIKSPVDLRQILANRVLS